MELQPGAPRRRSHVEQLEIPEGLPEGFTAGSNSGGYTLFSVAVVFAHTTGSPGNVRVTLNAPDTGNTDNPAASALATLSGPATPSSGT